MPVGYDLLADALDAAELDRRTRAIREQIEQAVGRMPAHEQFLSSYCPANRAAAEPPTGGEAMPA